MLSFQAKQSIKRCREMHGEHIIPLVGNENDAILYSYSDLSTIRVDFLFVSKSVRSYFVEFN